MSTYLDALRTSVQRLSGIVEPLDDDTITHSAYPAEWTIARVMAHLGSGAYSTPSLPGEIRSAGLVSRRDAIRLTRTVSLAA